MNAKIEVAMVALTALFVFGCERTENAKEAVPIHAGNVETVFASKDDVTAATLARITSASVTLTNYLYCESDKVMGLCQRIGSDISTLPPEIGQFTTSRSLYVTVPSWQNVGRGRWSRTSR
jgi:hypothetical protein